MLSYQDVKQSLFADESVAPITGVPLQGQSFRRWQPIQPCICVTEPCPCDRLDDIIVWVPTDLPAQRSGRLSKGDDVLAFELEPGTSLLVEAQIPVTRAQLAAVKSSPTLRKVATSMTAHKPSVKDLLAGAFAVGFAIGEAIDEGTGLSDEVSDWLAEHIPWPF